MRSAAAGLPGLLAMAGSCLANPQSSEAARLAAIAVAVWHDTGNMRAGSLERALGLCGRGGANELRARGQSKRDELLCEVRKSPVFCALDNTTAADAMIASCEAYAGNGWLRDRHKRFPPELEPAKTWWRLLRRVERPEHAIPLSRKQILRVLQRRATGSFPGSKPYTANLGVLSEQSESVSRPKEDPKEWELKSESAHETRLSGGHPNPRLDVQGPVEGCGLVDRSRR